MAYFGLVFNWVVVYLFRWWHPSLPVRVRRPSIKTIMTKCTNHFHQKEERFSAKRSSQAVFLQRVHHHYLDWAPLVGGRLQCPNQTCDSSNFPAFAVFGSQGEKNDFVTCVRSLGDDGASNHHRQNRHGHQLQTAVTWVLDELERNPKNWKSSKYNF